jgi:hypothetical protein
MELLTGANSDPSMRQRAAADEAQARRRTLFGRFCFQWSVELAQSSRRATAWVRSLNPLRHDVREIESRFGASVASFFEFFAWITLVYFFVGGAVLLWSLRHLLLVGDFEFTEVAGLFVPRFLLQSSYAAVEAVDFAGIVLLSGVALAAFAIRKWIQEDLEEKSNAQQEGRGIGGEAFSGGVQQPFTKLLLNPWDHGTTEPTAAHQLKLVNGELVLLLIHEANLDHIIARRKPQEWAYIYATRALGHFGSLALLGLAAWAIVELSVASGDIERTIRTSTDLGFLAPVADSIVPAGIALLNSITFQTMAYLLAASGFAVPIFIQFLFAIGSLMVPKVLKIPPFPSVVGWLIYVAKSNAREWDTISNLAMAFSLPLNGIGSVYLTLAYLDLALTALNSIVTKIPASREPACAWRLVLTRMFGSTLLNTPMLCMDLYIIFAARHLLTNSSEGIVIFSAVTTIFSILTRLFSTCKDANALLPPEKQIKVEITVTIRHPWQRRRDEDEAADTAEGDGVGAASGDDGIELVKGAGIGARVCEVGAGPGEEGKDEANQ